MEMGANNMVLETPVLEDAKAAEIKLALEYFTELMIDGINKCFDKREAREHVVSASEAGIGSEEPSVESPGFSDEQCKLILKEFAKLRAEIRTDLKLPEVRVTALEAASPIDTPGSFIMNAEVDVAAATDDYYIDVDAPTNHSMKCPGCAIDLVEAAAAYTTDKELDLNRIRAAAATTAADLVPSNTDVGSPSTRSIICLSGVIDVTSLDVVSIVAGEPVIDHAQVAVGLSALDIEHNNIDMGAPAGCSMKCPGRALHAMAPTEMCAIVVEAIPVPTHDATLPTTITVMSGRVNSDTPLMCLMKCPVSSSGIMAPYMPSYVTTCFGYLVSNKLNIALDIESGDCATAYMLMEGTGLNFYQEKLCDTIVLWEQPMKWINWLPWPPPTHVEIRFCIADMPPIPWLSFSSGDGSKYWEFCWCWKPPWHLLISFQCASYCSSMCQEVKQKCGGNSDCQVLANVQLHSSVSNWCSRVISLCGSHWPKYWNIVMTVSMSFRCAEVHVIVVLIPRADGVYVQISSAILVIFLCLTWLLEHAMVLIRELIELSLWLSPVIMQAVCKLAWLMRISLVLECVIDGATGKLKGKHRFAIAFSSDPGDATYYNQFSSNARDIENYYGNKLQLSVGPIQAPESREDDVLVPTVLNKIIIYLKLLLLQLSWDITRTHFRTQSVVNLLVQHDKKLPKLDQTIIMIIPQPPQETGGRKASLFMKTVKTDTLHAFGFDCLMPFKHYILIATIASLESMGQQACLMDYFIQFALEFEPSTSCSRSNLQGKKMDMRIHVFWNHGVTTTTQLGGKLPFKEGGMSGYYYGLWE